MFSFRLSFPFLGSSEPQGSIELEPVERERMSPAGFLSTLESDPDKIESSSFIPPRLGDDHFGYFEVEYRTPVYR